MRVLVSIFAALLILISLYQLSFTWFVNRHEKSMSEKAVQQTKRSFADFKLPTKKALQKVLRPRPITTTRTGSKNCSTPQKTKRLPGGDNPTRRQKKVSCFWALTCKAVST